jgi:UDP-glucose 4-epimerase
MLSPWRRRPARGASTADMRVLVTGSNGHVGVATLVALSAAGHEAEGTDLSAPGFVGAFRPPYVQADLTDAGDAYAIVDGFDAVVHTAALHRPGLVTSHAIFQNNVMATFNVVEAVARARIPFLVNISSVAVLGYSTATRRFPPDYLPIDEEHALRPHEPYALSKLLGEKIVDAAVERSDLRAVSLRPPWVLAPETYQQLLPLRTDPHQLKWGFWSYVDVRDLASAVVLALSALRDGAELSAHEALFIAAADNSLGQPLRDLAAECFGDGVSVRPQTREDSSGVSSSRAGLLLGYTPAHSWRDFLDQSPS